uniref:DUF4773 domain-containing protein n=1 Tax=Timema cristinae TaxID=61476 RepID=A0A7R9CSP4_TIMCR|nr:unnamed protein product [Timema cristinae]
MLLVSSTKWGSPCRGPDAIVNPYLREFKERGEPIKACGCIVASPMLGGESYACVKNMRRFNYLPVLFLCLQLAQTVSILGEYHKLTVQLSPSVVPLQLAQTVSILDLLSWNLDASQEDTSVQRDSESSAPINLKTCNCEGPTCRCCVDFNLTYVDLGGPGCVEMKYLSPEEGIAVNVSYGESLLHSEAVKGARPDPTCMDILSDLAQMCARFVDLAPTSDGLRWCLQIEPTLLGEVQAEYHVGCFRMDPKGMDLDPAYNSSARPAQTSTEPSDEEGTTETINEEALLEAVNESAEEGIAFFSNLLSLTLGNLSNGTVVENSTSSITTTPATVADTESRRAGRGHLLVTHSASNEVV